MLLRQALVLLLAACVVCCHAYRSSEGYEEEDEYKDGYKGDEYKEKEYDEEEYKRYNYNYKKRDNPPDYKPYQEGPPGYNPRAYENYEYDRYGPPPPSYGYEGYGGYEQDGYGGYERDGYGGYEKEGYEGYEGYGDGDYKDGYYSPGPGGVPNLPCKDPHKWPYAWWNAGLLCVNPESGNQKLYNATTCKGAGANSGTALAPKVCVQWPGTMYACEFTPSPMTKPCRKASDVCDITDFCPGTTGVCGSDQVVGPNIKVCRWSRGPCEQNAWCDGSKKTCPTSWVPKDTKCRNASEEYGEGYGYSDNGYGYDADEPFTPTGPCDAEDVCTGSSALCPNTVKPKGDKCGSAPSGACDEQDVCDGVTDKCKDIVKAKGTVCNAASAAPCILGGKCDGTAKTCPALKHAPTGTPCNQEGLFKEAMDADGKVAIKSRYSKKEAEMHGWAECNRCYEGECQTFKWEYWNADKHGDSHKSTTPKTYNHKYTTHKYTSSKKPASGKKVEASAYAVEEAEAPEVVEFKAEGTSEYYPTQIFETLGVDASIQSSGDHKGKAKKSYEPEVYCHNPYTRKDYN